MKYVIGIDGGGTKTALKITDLSGEVLSEASGGPSNINSSSKEEVQRLILNLIDEGISKKNLIPSDCLAICMGTAGADREEDKAIIGKMIKDSRISGEIIVVNDAEIALTGGVEKDEGVILISGTGSICFGRTADGRKYRSGGWGHIIGDEGSGYDIGINAIKAALKSYDGRGEKTILQDKVIGYYNLPTHEDLIEYIYRSGAGKREIAALTRIVNEGCLIGDKVCLEIIMEAAYELFLCVKSVIEKLGFSNKPVLLTTSGGSINNINILYDEFLNILNKSYPKVKIIRMKNDAAFGATLIARTKVKQI